MNTSQFIESWAKKSNFTFYTNYFNGAKRSGESLKENWTYISASFLIPNYLIIHSISIIVYNSYL